MEVKVNISTELMPLLLNLQIYFAAQSRIQKFILFWSEKKCFLKILFGRTKINFKKLGSQYTQQLLLNVHLFRQQNFNKSDNSTFSSLTATWIQNFIKLFNQTKYSKISSNTNHRTKYYGTTPYNDCFVENYRRNQFYYF